MKNLSSFSSAVRFLASNVAPVVATPESKLYPFVGAKACKKALETDGDVRDAILAILFHSQTEMEQNRKATTDKNRCGFMSSHAKSGTTIGAKVVAGEELTAEEEQVAYKIACSYSRQMSVVLREFAMANDESLVAHAATFSVKF